MSRARFERKFVNSAAWCPANGGAGDRTGLLTSPALCPPVTPTPPPGLDVAPRTRSHAACSPRAQHRARLCGSLRNMRVSDWAESQRPRPGAPGSARPVTLRSRERGDDRQRKQGDDRLREETGPGADRRSPPTPGALGLGRPAVSNRFLLRDLKTKLLNRI